MFSRELRDDVLAGEITVSFRLWKRPKVKVGGRYPVGPGHGLIEQGVIEVDDIERVPFAAITAADVRRAGEPDRETLRRRAAHAGPVDDDTLLYRVEFHIVPVGAGPAFPDLAALGPFFAVRAHRPGQAPAAPWRPVSELAGRPGPLAGRVAMVRAVLAARSGRLAAEIDPRVAASAVHLGLVARLVSPALAAAALGQHLDLRLEGLWWQAELGGPVPLSVPVPGPGTGPVNEDWHQQLLAGVIAPLTTATSRAVPVSDRVLRGNVASAINAAAGQVAAARPGLASPAWAAARALFASPWLAREPGPPGPGFRRASCCLFYRLAPDAPSARAAICGDCVLREAPAPR